MFFAKVLQQKIIPDPMRLMFTNHRNNDQSISQRKNCQRNVEHIIDNIEYFVIQIFINKIITREANVRYVLN